MKRNQSLVAAIALMMVLATGALADTNQYLCVVEHSAGLHHDPQSKAWGPQAFRGDRKYIMRRLTDHDRSEWGSLVLRDKNANWAFLELGNKFPTAICEEGALKFDCTIVSAEVQFDRDSNRFETVHGFGAYIDQGYWEKMHQEDPARYRDLLSRKQANDISHPDDMFFEIGKCSPF